ncbi:MAG: regulatory iron-sulfur-containing complex subunit RicT [Clostridia bacterium]|nr:regulatory iron-sulfur-containing complex subunit RicT [Clostridia bacterium]
MEKVIEVRLKKFGKIYLCKTEKSFKIGDKVVVEFEDNVNLATVVSQNADKERYKNENKIGTVLRKASVKDLKIHAEQVYLEKKAYEVCKKNIERLEIPMRLIKVKSLFDGSKLIFYFTAEGRVDFRRLVRALAVVFKTRIELRQVGVRDKAKIVGGLGICGKELCCRGVLPKFQSVSVKMAKEQGMSLSPGKISGICGRLMCCLKYEQEVYDELWKKSPKIGAIVDTPDGRGAVTEVNLLMNNIKVSLLSGENLRPKLYSMKDVKIIENKKISIDKKEWDKLKELEGK